MEQEIRCHVHSDCPSSHLPARRRLVGTVTLVAVVCVAALAGGGRSTGAPLARLQAGGAPVNQERKTQLLQWFGLAEGSIDEGHAPASGEREAEKLGIRDGVIPKGNVVEGLGNKLPGYLLNSPLSAAAIAREMGQKLHPLLDESSDEDEGESKVLPPAPAWVREDNGKVTEREVHEAKAAETAAFIQHQRAVAQQRWAINMGLPSPSASPEEQETGSVVLDNAPEWVRKDYEGDHASREKQAVVSRGPAFGAITHFPKPGEEQDNKALIDEAHLKAELIHKAELQLAHHSAAVEVETLASEPLARHSAAPQHSLLTAAEVLVKQHEASEHAAEENSAKQELSELEQEAKTWTTPVSERKAQGKIVHTSSPSMPQPSVHAPTEIDYDTNYNPPRISVSGLRERIPWRRGAAKGELAAEKEKLGLSVNVDATMPSAAAVRAAAAAAAAARRSRLEVPARLQMLAGGDKSLVMGLQSILQNLKSLTLVSPQSSSSARAASAADSADAGGTRAETAAQQQQDLLQLAAAARDGAHKQALTRMRDPQESSALLKRLQRQLLGGALPAMRSSSSLASERQAGEAQEAARLHQLISEGARTHLHAAIAAATAEERREQTHEGLQGTQEKEDAKMKAIDRLFNKLYGAAGAAGGERGGAAAQQLMAAQQVRGRSDLAIGSHTAVQQQQLDAPPPPPPPAAPEQPPPDGSPEAKAARIAQEKDELKAAEKMAERPWNGDADYGAQGQEDETDEHMRMIKRRNYVGRVIYEMERSAASHGIENANDIETIHRLQKAYPYNIRDVSQKWAKCAMNAVILSRDTREMCANHFVWLMLKRSLNQSYCSPEKKKARDCAPSDTVRNPGFDACINPLLTDNEVHQCLLRITQLTPN